MEERTVVKVPSQFAGNGNEEVFETVFYVADYCFGSSFTVGSIHLSSDGARPGAGAYIRQHN